jgi:hypothetical protein
MGFKTWGNLSVLLFAGAALVGCNNTPQKTSGLGKGPEGPKLADTSVAKGQPNVPGPNFPNGAGSLQQYPKGGVNPSPFSDNTPKNPAWPPSGNNPSAVNPSFRPDSPGIGGLKDNPLPPNPFALPPGGNNNGSSVTPPPNPFGNQPVGGSVNKGPSLTPASDFATTPGSLNTPTPVPGGATLPPVPVDFPKRN